MGRRNFRHESRTAFACTILCDVYIIDFFCTTFQASNQGKIEVARFYIFPFFILKNDGSNFRLFFDELFDEFSEEFTEEYFLTDFF